MVRSNLTKGLLLTAAALLLGVAFLKAFGTTVSEKYTDAAERVHVPISFESSVGPPVRPSTGVQPTNLPQAATPAPEPIFERVVNLETSPVIDRFSTFSVDVDTGSYTLARRTIERGNLPALSSVRVEEFVNYFDYDYEPRNELADAEPELFSTHFELAPSPLSAEEHTVLKIGVQARELAAAERPGVHLTLLVDVSGSMGRPDRLTLAKASLSQMVRHMKPGDTVAIVTYAGRVERVLEPTDVSDAETIIDAISNLRAGGMTNMNNGMELAYRLAAKSARPGDVSRVMVVSDGDANIGAATHSEILASIRGYVDEGITLSAVGFGLGNYNDTLMEDLAKNGNGNYFYIDSPDEAKRLFGERLESMLHVLAHDVKIQVEFDPATVESWRLVGYENRDIADADFREDAVDAAEVGPGHSVTALYELKLNRSVQGPVASVRVRHKESVWGEGREFEFRVGTNVLLNDLAHASDDFRFAVAVAGFAEILRKSPYADHLTLGAIREIAASSTGSHSEDRRGFVSLVDRTRRLFGPCFEQQRACPTHWATTRRAEF